MVERVARERGAKASTAKWQALRGLEERGLLVYEACEPSPESGRPLYRVRVTGAGSGGDDGGGRVWELEARDVEAWAAGFAAAADAAATDRDE